MLPLTRHGTREMVIGTMVLLAIGFGLSFVHPYLSLLVLPVLIWLFAFFRDPERPITTEPHLMVSPADGMVSDVGEVDSEHIGERCLRIGIFLSVFNVHVNRAPCDGEVTNVVYKKGKFINAMSHGSASSDNESNTIIMEAGGQPVAVIKQIVGLIARRIICTSKIGDTVKRGDRIGMIKFGSRTELYIPLRLHPSANVKVGQKVRGGLDIIARLSPATSSEAPATPIGASA